MASKAITIPGLKKLAKEIKPRPFDRDSNCAVIKLSPIFLQKLSYKDRDSISLLLKIKQRYVNGRVYFYSPKKLSQELGVSEYLIKKHVSFLVEKNYAYMDGATLVTRKLNRINKRKRYRCYSITVHKDNSIKDISEKLNLIILKANFRKQDFYIQTKRIDLEIKGLGKKKEIRTKKDIKKVRKALERFPGKLQDPLREYNYTGMRNFSKLIGCSQDTAARIVKSAKKKKIIKTKQIESLYVKGVGGHFDSDEYKSMNGIMCGYIYKHKHCLYIHMGTQIKFVFL